MKLYVGIDLSSHEWANNVINSVYDTLRIKNPTAPHITLVPPIEVNHEDFRMLPTVLSNLLNDVDIPPILAPTTGVRSFGSKVIFLGIEPTKELVDLRAKILAIISQFSSAADKWKGSDFVPHITIAKGLKPRQHVDVINLITDSNRNLKYPYPALIEVNSVTVWGKTEIDNKWMIRARSHFYA